MGLHIGIELRGDSRFGCCDPASVMGVWLVSVIHCQQDPTDPSDLSALFDLSDPSDPSDPSDQSYCDS